MEANLLYSPLRGAFRFRRGVFFALSGMVLASVGSAPAFAQDEEEDDGEIIELSPFKVTTDRDVGYLSTNSTSGTSLNIAIKDLPMAVQVINQEFITDQAASNLDEALTYSAGVFTSDNEASSSVGATRGRVGGGSGDKSISSAGRGSRFANLVYIRGLSTPYQNRMGFRYGGLVVTPNSEIALGGLLDSANIERIEVVKGPNSLLYGVGVLTGIVNVIPERPLAEPRYEVSFRLGSYDFMRAQMDFTGPVKSDWIPGELNWRLASSYEERGSWTDFREDRTEYWVAQLEYKPTSWAKIFLEYQDGMTRNEGIASQWIYDDINDANDKEFRNAYDEAYNWARHSGTIDRLRPIDPDSFMNVGVVDDDGPTGATQAGFRLMDTPFQGGDKPDSYRITGPDTFAERNEQNFIADLELYPVKGLTVNVGAFFSQQETEELTLQFGSATISSPNTFHNVDVKQDSQLGAIYEAGGIYGVPMQDVVKDVFGLNLRVNSDLHAGDWVLPALTDDIKLTEYWWRHSIVKSASEQYRVRATYTFDAELFGTRTTHTVLAGWSYIKDDIDFPDGGINRGNARANRADTFGDYQIGSEPGKVAIGHSNPENLPTFGSLVANPYDNDGLYYRSIANFAPIYLDGRNDGVDGHNVVRAGDAYLNQVIEQQGLYAVYQGKFFDDKLDVIFGARQDTYNARQLTYKRANVTDEFLRTSALEAYSSQAYLTASRILGDSGSQPSPETVALAEQILADRTATGTYVASWYRDSFESGDEGYFGYADRGGAPDKTYGVVPGSRFNVFEKDVQVTTGTFGLNYAITPEITVYGVVAQGISPNTALRDGAGEIIPAEETLNREVGVKFDLMDGKFSGNVAVFSIKRKHAIWDVALAPSASKWLDAQTSLNRANSWTVPTYDPATPTTYFVRSDYLRGFLAQAFGINPDKLNFAQAGNQLQQQVGLGDLDPNLSILQRLQIVRDVQTQTLFPESFASQWNSQAPFGGNIQINVVGVEADGMDDLQDITLYNPETNEFVTRSISNLAIVYAAFMDRELDVTKNPLLGAIHPIRYNRFNTSSQPQDNNNVDFNQSRGALVTFDETINGVEFEVFFTPTPNLQFVVNYTHVEREADNTFDFTDWESIAGTQGNYVGPFTMLHREYGWASAGLQLAWVDYDAYASVRDGGDGTVALADLADGAVELVDASATDQPISGAEFSSRGAAGEILVFVDRRGNVLNEANNPRASDYEDILSGVSLNFNPEDELALWGRYKFDGEHGFLNGLTLNAGFKYIGPSRTSIAFNSVSPLNELTTTPEVGERYRFDLGASYEWMWQKIRWRLSFNIYDILQDTYEVTTETLTTPNPITGASVTKRTEKFYSPTTYRLGLSASF